MKPKELKDLMAKLKKHYVFYEEAIKMVEKNYKNQRTAKTTLTNWINAGKVEKVETINMPALYKKKDILTMVKK